MASAADTGLGRYVRIETALTGRSRLSRAATTIPVLMLLAISGCASLSEQQRRTRQQLAEVMRPLLELDPEANWTAHFNRMLEIGPAALEYLATSDAMTERAEPDDLRVMIRTSLMRQLADPARAPRISVRCFETTFELLHFDPKVRGHSIGRVAQFTERPPQRWHDLYPAGFDHALASEIDVDADRLAMIRWWSLQRGSSTGSMRASSLNPQTQYLWPILMERPADRWVYSPNPQAWVCSPPPPGPELFRLETFDYNLARATCIWLASLRDSAAMDALVDLVGSRDATANHNARFALQRSWDPRIRELISDHEPASPDESDLPREDDSPSPAVAGRPEEQAISGC